MPNARPGTRRPCRPGLSRTLRSRCTLANGKQDLARYTCNLRWSGLTIIVGAHHPEFVTNSLPITKLNKPILITCIAAVRVFRVHLNAHCPKRLISACGTKTEVVERFEKWRRVTKLCRVRIFQKMKYGIFCLCFSLSTVRHLAWVHSGPVDSSASCHGGAPGDKGRRCNCAEQFLCEIHDMAVRFG